MAGWVKNLPVMQKMKVWFLHQEDPLEEEMATHSSILAWKVPWTEELGGLQSMESQRVKHAWALTHLKINGLNIPNKRIRLSDWFKNSSLYDPAIATATAKSLQSCLTLCDPIDSSPPGSPVPGILQARTLEWVAFSFSNAWKWKVKVKLLVSDS